jgi:serine/threonine protein kinase/tetratricopeptide (TPR) repeat protein
MAPLPNSDPSADSPTRTVALRAVHSLQTGHVLAGRFRIDRFLGGGGMGEVYLADDLELGGTVALKILRTELLSDPLFLNRFKREVQLSRQVTHLNICRIFDVGRHTEEGLEVAFLTMEYIEGETLSSYLRKHGRLTLAEALPLLRQIAEGLSALHEKGIVHRDFKPSNVMVAGDRAVVTDFGLARAMAGATSVHPGPDATKSTHITGTPDYIAPEQLLGDDPTPAADIYTFGLVIYEMLTGAKPFPSFPALHSAVQRFTQSPTPPSQHTADISKQQETIILRCLATIPGDRPSSARDVVAALAGELSLAAPAPVRPPRLNRRTLAIAAIGTALIASIGWVGRGWWSTADRQIVTVLPFQVQTDDASLRVFSDGLMESIASQLSAYENEKSSFLVVPARETIQQSVKTPADARNKFGSDSVVTGIMQAQGARVRLLLTLVDTKRMVQTETIAVEDDRANALHLQDVAVERLATALGISARPKQQLTMPAAPGVYDYQIQARGYLLRNDKLESLDSAISLFNRVLESDSRYAPAHAGLAQAHWYKFGRTREQQSLQSAIDIGRKAIEIAPNLADAQVTMGQISLGTGRTEEALKYFESALTSEPRNTAALQGLAEAYYNLKQFDRAEDTYKKAIALRRDDWNGYRALGLFYYRRSDFPKAIEQYRQVVALTPDNPMGWANLGAFQIRNSDRAGAKKSLHRALELDPKRMSTLANLGKLYFDEGAYRQAAEHYERAAKIAPKDYKPLGMLGMSYIRAGDRARAVQPIEAAISLIKSEVLVNPKRAELYATLASYEANLGRKDAARQAMDRALSLAPEDNDVVIRAAEASATIGETERAVTLLRQLLQRGFSRTTLRESVVLRPLVDRINPKP